jgi:HJR/Mrr/RecB family endonuclease
VVQQTFGVTVLVGAQRCLVVASGEFSSKVRELQTERKDVVLIDGKQLLA